MKKTIQFTQLAKLTSRADTVISVAQVIYYIVLGLRLSTYMQPLLAGLPATSMSLLELMAINTSFFGILILIVGVVVFGAVFYVTLRKYQKKDAGLLKTLLILFWNAIWIVGDLYMLFLIFAVFFQN